jgi:hypothetical protein
VTENASGFTGGTLNYLANSSGAFIAPGAGAGQNNQYPVASPGGSFVITTVGLSTVGTTGNSANGDAITITKTFCIGTSACTAADEVTLVATIGNNSSTPSYTCVAGASSSASCGSASSGSPILATYAVSVFTLNVTDIYKLTAPGPATTSDTLTSFTDSFGEQQIAPEPSTFVLLGGALALIMGIRYRQNLCVSRLATSMSASSSSQVEVPAGDGRLVCSDHNRREV